MSYLYHTFLYDPLFNGLIVLYNTVAFHDLGIAIILLTIVIRVLLFPLFAKSARHQMIMQALQEKLKKIQQEHKKDLQKQSEAMMALYKEHNINPFSGIGLLFIQLPILIALYQIFINIFSPDALQVLYSFVTPPGTLDTSFLGLINLEKRSILMVSLAAITQFIQIKTSMPPRKEGADPANKAAEAMVWIGPILTLVIFWNFPAAIGLYWVVTSVFSIGQQVLIKKQLEHERLAKLPQ